MAWSRNWARILDFYSRMADTSMLPEEAVMGIWMVRLVETIIGDPTFASVQPGLALSALRLKISGRSQGIYVFCPFAGYYTIYLDHPEKQGHYVGKHTVPAEEAIGSLRQILRRLSNEHVPG